MNIKHSVKIKLLIVLLGLGTGTTLWASPPHSVPQSTLYREIRYKPQFHLYIGGGMNTNLARFSSNQPAAALFAQRTAIAPYYDCRLTHLFSPRFGWYADIRLKFFDMQSSNPLIDALLDLLIPGITKIHPACSAGLVYRFEGERWQCYPRIGIGKSYYGGDYEKQSTWDKRTHEEWCRSSSLCMNLGVSTQYRLTPKIALMMDIFFQEPLTRAKSYLIDKNDGITLQEYAYSNRSIGRELNASLGIGLWFGKALKKK